MRLKGAENDAVADLPMTISSAAMSHYSGLAATAIDIPAADHERELGVLASGLRSATRAGRRAARIPRRQLAVMTCCCSCNA